MQSIFNDERRGPPSMKQGQKRPSRPGWPCLIDRGPPIRFVAPLARSTTPRGAPRLATWYGTDQQRWPRRVEKRSRYRSCEAAVCR